MAENLEQQCEDAVFALCDARERYPQRCADELQKCIKLNNEINMMRINVKPGSSSNILITEKQKALVDNYSFADKTYYEEFDQNIYTMMSKFETLKAVMEQIQNQKNCEINKLLKN